MEDLGRTFPLISKIILNNVDDKSLANFRRASRENRYFLDNERFYWIRNIKKYSETFEEFQESWNKVIKKTPVGFLKNLAIDVHSFFKGISTRLTEQWHPLFIGAGRGSLPLCEHVVERTGDVNPKQNDGFTPLGFAAQEGHLEICTFLLKYIDDKKLQENNGRTPFHRAASSGKFEVCTFFLNHLDNKNPRNNEGSTPLHLASEKGHLDICKLIQCKRQKSTI